ncbi:MAG: bifunctional [glutamate--ammonia ligase]-adenylyl-L-tyrosine phosphorylase/[glutamate--ammonia-ligase] adenylyltransferase [Planctomycetia bacterium]|nr:bifunctional [glutamate--ammonia ligase]-adenylyl-L-tyrosine phosphorylase/[glutamate--ammonia-ligase] adenylyltransferase [Planctomycetia bacterium]
MLPDELRRLLDDPPRIQAVVSAWGVQDQRRAHDNLLRMAESGVTLDLLARMADILAAELPRLSDADMALNNLERFVAVARNPLSLAALFERDAEALPILLKIFSTSQHLSDLLVSDGEAYDLLRMTEGQPVERQPLVAELCAEIATLADEIAKKELRRFKRRELLRIAYGDIILDQTLTVVTAQISYLADALVEAAVQLARRNLAAKRGTPRDGTGLPARFVVLGLGKLGGFELNYSSDIDLVLLYHGDGRTDGPRPIDNSEFFDQLGREFVRILDDATQDGQVYRVDLRLRPEGDTGPIVWRLEDALRYYDLQGRTWERQAYVKARPVAGDLDLGKEFLRQLEPWIYRRYLGLADIAGIKALKRRIEERAIREGTEERNVKTGRGGIRDIEFAIQFLQLLNGGDLPELRAGNTLVAMASLEKAGCLTHAEHVLLEENYAFLRKIEHRLQIMFDLQTHELPADDAELRKLAIRLGYADKPGLSARQAFQKDYEHRTEGNRKVLDHLLHDAFGDDAQAEPEVDLVLDPDPPRQRVEEILSRYRFRDTDLAYRNLASLSTERIPFLSTRRCRHFLASNAPKLLRAVAETPDPDSTLVNLEKVSDSLGGKGVLWELFNFNPPTLRLYVELCATSPFLSAILISNPGMIDELMDGLLLDKLPALDWLRRTITELCRGAEDLQPILHSFKNTQQLHIGVRDILAKEDIDATTQALTDVAQVCLEQIARDEYEKLVARLGRPTIGPPAEEGAPPHPRQGQPCELIVLALGKFGGGELGYHSDLDVIFLYDAEGMTVPQARGASPTTNGHFFNELGAFFLRPAVRRRPPPAAHRPQRNARHVAR